MSFPDSVSVCRTLVHTHICETTHIQLHQMFCACCLWTWLSPALVTCNMLCTSGFVDDVLFSYLDLMAA